MYTKEKQADQRMAGPAAGNAKNSGVRLTESGNYGKLRNVANTLKRNSRKPMGSRELPGGARQLPDVFELASE
jgi:hypothetical protein